MSKFTKDMTIFFVFIPVTVPFIMLGYVAGLIFLSCQCGWFWADRTMHWIPDTEEQASK